MNELERKLQRARNEMIAERFGQVEDRTLTSKRPQRGGRAK